VPIWSRNEVAALFGKLIIRTRTRREVSKPPSSFHMEISLWNAGAAKTVSAMLCGGAERERVDSRARISTRPIRRP
jgi:hypothetical protein